jgi:hypothetical protein
VVGKVALGQVFLRVLQFSPANNIPPLLHIHISPPHDMCDSSDQAAHYHHLDSKLGASFLTRHFGWKQNKKEKERKGYRKHAYVAGMNYSVTFHLQLIWLFRFIRRTINQLYIEI